MMPAISQDACQDLLSPCSVVSFVAAPRLSDGFTARAYHSPSLARRCFGAHLGDTGSDSYVRMYRRSQIRAL